MKILYAKALVKDLEAVSRNPGVKKRLLKIIETLKAIDTLDELHHLKKIEGYDCYPSAVGFRSGACIRIYHSTFWHQDDGEKVIFSYLSP